MSPRFIGPYEIIEKVDSVEYRLALQEEFSLVHNVFNVSKLRKYISEPSHVLEPPEIDVTNDMTYEKQRVKIVGKEKVKNYRVKSL